MGLFNKLLSEFIDIIEWVDTGTDTIVWKFPRTRDEIKMGTKLTVRESQVAVFINEGTIADVFQPGMYTLSTQNMPLLSTLKGWKYGFNSPFKADVYFVSTHQFVNQKWGTKNPVMARDAEYGPVRLRAYGSYAFKVNDAERFIKEISATNTDFVTSDINEQLRNIAVTRCVDAIASSGISILDLAANYDDISELALKKMQPDFNELGLSLSKFLLENISLPPEVEKMLDKRTGMGMLGNLGAYTQFQAANSIEKAAENPSGGLASAGIGLGMGAGMAQLMGTVFQQGGNATPPPLPQTAEYYVAINGKQEGPFGLTALKQMAQNGTLTRQSLAWKAGMAAWAAADSVNELAAIFNTIPPPLA